MSQPVFLLIETSSVVCSVAVTRGSSILSLQENNSRDHAATLAPLAMHALENSNLQLKDVTCIGINGGPGSYTGLRIGLSFAKGLCFAARKPLVIINALQTLAHGVLETNPLDGSELLLTTIDNRRDELFYSLFDKNANSLTPVTLTTTNDAQFIELLNSQRPVVAGSGVDKLKLLDAAKGLGFISIRFSATHLLSPVQQRFTAQEFDSIAYSEPLYYKEVYISSRPN